MKRTTYILIAMLVAGLLLTGTFAYFLTCGEKPASSTEIGTLSSMKSEPLPAFKRVVFTTEDEKMSPVVVPIGMGPADSTGSSISYVSELEPYMKLDLSEDSTLNIHFCFPKDRFPENQWHSFLSMRLLLPKEADAVYNHTPYVTTFVKGLERDAFSVSTQNRIELSECKFGTLSASGGSLHFKSGSAGHLHIDLDATNEWYIHSDSFHVDTEHLTGSGTHYCRWVKNESRSLKWYPKTEGAKLNIELREAAEIVRKD